MAVSSLDPSVLSLEHARALVAEDCGHLHVLAAGRVVDPLPRDPLALRQRELLAHVALHLQETATN
eukprot:9128954-Pyramimonas_sp.AAC.1